MAETTKSDARPPDWERLLRRYKEKIAEKVWSLPTVTEAEKEMVFGGLLSDLDDVERHITDLLAEADARRKSTAEENDLLRGLLGTTEDEVRAKAITLAQDLAARESEVETLQGETEALRASAAEAERLSEELRQRLRSQQNGTETERLQHLRQREDDIRFYSESSDVLKNQMHDLETRLANLRVLFADANQQMVTEKQEEITLLQKNLLSEMESTLRRKQQLMWAEEETFANGVAHRVRSALVSAQGQLLLTLERLGLLDPEKRSEAVWKARFRLFIDGAPELSRDFRAIQKQLQDLTGLLDDYLHLTRRRPLGRDMVSLREIIKNEQATLYLERRPTLALEILSDDPLPDIQGDTSMIRFVVGELIKNAIESLPNETGRVVVSLKNHPERRDVELVVRDTGGGIPGALQGRLFEPFFTTKEHRQGLSLNRARRYVEFHGGQLVLLQTGPQGTSFQATFPWQPLENAETDPVPSRAKAAS